MASGGSEITTSRSRRTSPGRLRDQPLHPPEGRRGGGRGPAPPQGNEAAQCGLQRARRLWRCGAVVKDGGSVGDGTFSRFFFETYIYIYNLYLYVYQI